MWDIGAVWSGTAGALDGMLDRVQNKWPAVITQGQNLNQRITDRVKITKVKCTFKIFVKELMSQDLGNDNGQTLDRVKVWFFTMKQKQTGWTSTTVGAPAVFLGVRPWI